MKTYMATKDTVQRKWYVVDAEGKVFGRMASEVAAILIGKHKPEYTPNVDTGDNVIIINAEKAVLTGNKLLNKKYYSHSGYPGGLKSVQYGKLMAEKPEFAVREAVRRMLPKSRLGRDMINKLHVFAGPEHNHQAQQPEVLELKG